MKILMATLVSSFLLQITASLSPEEEAERKYYALEQTTVITMGQLGPRITFRQGGQHDDGPLYDLTKLGGTASIGDDCDLDLYNTYISPIYQALKLGNLVEFSRALYSLMDELNKMNSTRSQSCFGYMENPAIKGQELMRAYKCSNVSKKCICFDEPPLVYQFDTSAVTNCSFRNPVANENCTFAPSLGYEKLLSRFFDQIWKAKGQEQIYQAFSIEYLAFIQQLQQNLHHVQAICFRDDLTLKCGSNDTCVCRQSGYHFNSTLQGGQCLPSNGTFCQPHRHINSSSLSPPLTCASNQLNCSIVFKGKDYLHACGGYTKWCLQPPGICGSHQHQLVLSFLFKIILVYFSLLHILVK